MDKSDNSYSSGLNFIFLLQSWCLRYETSLSYASSISKVGETNTIWSALKRLFKPKRGLVTSYKRHSVLPPYDCAVISKRKSLENNSYIFGD
jgi:hypothetical protein